MQDSGSRSVAKGEAAEFKEIPPLHSLFDSPRADAVPLRARGMLSCRALPYKGPRSLSVQTSAIDASFAAVNSGSAEQPSNSNAMCATGDGSIG